MFIGHARKDNQHDEWDWNNKESHKLIRLRTEGGLYKFKLLDILPLYRAPGLLFWIPARVYFLRNPLAWYHFLICNAGTSLIVQPLHTSFLTVLLPGWESVSWYLIRRFIIRDDVIKMSVEEYLMGQTQYSILRLWLNNYLQQNVICRQRLAKHENNYQIWKQETCWMEWKNGKIFQLVISVVNNF